MNQSYLTSYQRIDDTHNPDETREPFQEDASRSAETDFPQMLIHVVPKSDKTRWNHIEDLDSFFNRIYQYHQQNGFVCMVVKQFFDLLNFIFITLFATFLFVYIDYDILFRNKNPPGDANKVTISDCILSSDEAWQNVTPLIVLLLIAALGFWLVKVFITVISYFKFLEIKKFYNYALGISDADLENVSWSDVQQHLIEVQVEQRMCVHKEVLTELDIYHRILRFENYLIAMIHKKVIPVEHELPILGRMIFFTRGLKYNIEFILFYGIGAPFINNWQLKEEFKRSDQRHRLAEELSQRIFYVGLVNFLLFPLILLFQILRAFFHYTEIIKREPGFLGLRTWSHYGKATLRHYNELDHELHARLNRAYRSATTYLNSFTSALGAVIARHVAFIFGALLAVLVLLTIYDEDVIQVEHVITLMTFLAAVTAFCRVLIPKENLVWCPELLMTKILSEVHYLPDTWKGKAHTSAVRQGFSQLFQYKFVHLIESLISPLITPAILCFQLRYKSLEIVDFLRNFTVEVVGVGDICTFAQMDLKRHGSRTWHPDLDTNIDDSIELHKDHTDGGKTELSLLHFTLTNPCWKPPETSSHFLDAIRTQARKDFTALSTLPEQENALHSSIHSIGLDEAIAGAAIRQTLLNSMRSKPVAGKSSNFLGHINQMEGSTHMFPSGILGSLSHSNAQANDEKEIITTEPSNEKVSLDEYFPRSRPQDLVAIDMSVSTLYLHELHHRFRAAYIQTDTPVRLNHPLSGQGRNRIRQPLMESYYHPTDSPAQASVFDSMETRHVNTSRTHSVEDEERLLLNI